MFIKDSTCISPQKTFPSVFGETNLQEHIGNKYFAIEPSYENLIPSGSLRRMGKSVRMGVAAGASLLSHAKDPDGIVIGTSSGGLEDCIKFLNQIVDYHEGTLTPTNFVQSTPNAIAGQLALIHRNTGYNITHSHGGLSFENALIDAMMLLENKEANQLLVGSIEEISEYNYNIDCLTGTFKTETVPSSSLLGTNTPGTVSGEGAALFLLTNEPPTISAVRIAAVTHSSFINKEDLPLILEDFLGAQELTTAHIDSLMLGYNGDTDSADWYDRIRQEFIPGTAVFTFKNACGEYPTASSFAVWLGQQILMGSPYPAELLVDGSLPGTVKNLLIYNHYRGVQHSFILLKSADVHNG